MTDQTPYTGTDNLDVMSGAINYNGFVANRISDCSSTKQVIVDFGAGTGTLSRLMRDKGAQVICIEVDQALRERLKLDGFETYNSFLDISDRRFDFIFSSNVLEHIEDHLSALRDIYRHLNDGGRLYLYVPAFNLLFSGMDRKVGHFRRYTKSSLIPILEEAGFEIDQSCYADSLGFLVTLVFRLFGDKSGAISSRSVKIYDRILFPVSRVLDRIFQPLFGKNLEVVARRPRQS